MTAPLFLADSVPDTVGAVAVITGTEAHHAATVRRLQVGEQVYVADGRGHASFGPVLSVAKTTVEVSVSQVCVEPPRPRRWVAIQALPKGERAELAVEMLTELGVDVIVAWQAARSVSRWDGAAAKVEKGVAKWGKTVREAAKQSRRFTVPEVQYASSAQVAEWVRSAALAVVCHEEASMWVESLTMPATGDVVFIIGPEGGISAEELAALEAAGGVPVRIASQVLRTSTAGAVALAELQSLSRRVV
ncbi:MAG: 16S rRNA (uracil(1498)-N(3))-methyltransferase [Propionibacteriaceae bacterium]|jgi:16S rRNA (uracil1498-N3)-methyltransferase|nr:16S rRNA (uracil(1498)-N(3))-methyltransferase [Propionibacteriaceae bacterium]